MVDIVDAATRSRMMSGIRGRDTKPELLIRRALHRAGLRYRLHVRGLPGTPDLVFPGRRAVIFVNGCFWHKHGCHLSKASSTRPEFWAAKLAANVERDRLAVDELNASGWRVATVWECSLKGRRRQSESSITEAIVEWLHEEVPMNLEVPVSAEAQHDH